MAESFGDFEFQVQASQQSVWVLVRQAGELRYAIRTGFIPSPRVDIREVVTLVNNNHQEHTVATINRAEMEINLGWKRID